MGRRPVGRSRAALNRGDIYLVPLDPTEGREQHGFRPVLVVSPHEFNEVTKLRVVLPITNGGAFDLEARHGRKLDTLPTAILDEVMARVATIFEVA